MDRRDFSYELPEHLIAQAPLAQRSASRLLCLHGDTGELQEATFRDLPTLLRAGDLLVFNDTRVVPARLLGHKLSGGRVEILLERMLDTRRLLAQIRCSKPPRVGGIIRIGEIGDQAELAVLGREGDFYELTTVGEMDAESLFRSFGQVPLPPYIRRSPDADDAERYQTVFARAPGAVAAPTAGLHFDALMLQRLREVGMAIGFVTLHVGAGTFQPMRAVRISDHRMHSEVFEVPNALVEQVRAIRSRGGRVIAVGTTVVRALETASLSGQLTAMQGQTNIFIYPGHVFRSVDAMITNFHLPESTLLMLVCAFAGREQVLAAYRYAVANEFRFFSYGDAMWVTCRAV